MKEHRNTLLAKLDEARQKGCPEIALTWAERVRDAFPDDVRGHVRVGQLLISLGRIAEARLQITKSLQAFENHPGLLGLLANACRISGDIDAALEVARVLHLHHPSAGSCARLVDLNIRAKNLSEAAALAEKGLKDFPNEFALLSPASNALRRVGNFEAALLHGKAARQANPDAPAGYLNEALALFELGQFRDALSAAEAGLDRFPTNVALLKSAFNSCVALSEYGQALVYAERRCAIAPDAESNQVDVIQTAIRLNELAIAGRYVEAAVHKFPDNKKLANLNWVVRESTRQDADTLKSYRSDKNYSSKTRFVFSIPFNIKRFRQREELSDPIKGRLSEAWISYRIKIFMNYTCKSLMNQSNQNFEALLLCDPLSIDVIKSEIAKYYELPPNIRVINGEDHNKLLNKLMVGYEYFCHTKLDSDNMYHRCYVEYLHSHIPKPETKFLAFTKGYAFDANTGRIALYRATREYFYARVGRVENRESDFQIPQPIGLSKEAELIPHELIHEPSMFIITCHDINVSNSVSLVEPSRTIFDPGTLASVWKGFTGDTTISTLGSGN